MLWRNPRLFLTHHPRDAPADFAPTSGTMKTATPEIKLFARKQFAITEVVPPASFAIQKMSSSKTNRQTYL